jgi:hypothetical protein
MKFFWILLFIGAVLVGTTWLFDAQADDTYNFYFQKAPGPVTVNQGAAPPSAATTSPAPDVKVQGSNVVVPASTSTTPAAPATEEASGRRNLEVSLGVAGSHYGGNGDSPYLAYHDPNDKSGMLNEGQFYAGLQYNFSDTVGVLGEGYRLTKNVVQDYKGPRGPEKWAAKGSLWDGGAHLVLTPFRPAIAQNVRLSLSATLGAISVPVLVGGVNYGAENGGSTPEIRHSGSFVFGGRASLDFGSRLSLQASIRRIQRFSATQGVATVAFTL